MKRPLIIANWKRYIESKEEAASAAKALARGALKVRADIVVCPPAVYLDAVGKALSGKGVALGAQSFSPASGAMQTGEVSAAMLADMGAKYVIVGHSERRVLGEHDETIRTLLSAALEKKLRPVLCIGEHARDSSGEHFDVITAQLRGSLPKLSAADQKRLVIAYEPVWAIGKSAAEAADPRMLEETVLYIRKVLADIIGRAGALAAPVLYGGSVEVENAATLIEAGVSGFLVGHASVDPKSLLAIAKAAQSAKQ